MENNTSLVYDRIFLIFEYIRFVIGILGVIGNVLVIIIFSRQSLRKYSYSFYCLIMAISDICFMSNVFIDWTAYIFGANLELVGTLFCKIVFLLPTYFSDFSAHLLTLIAIDRMITIVYPRRFLIMKKRWFQSLIVAILALIVLVRYIAIPLYANIIEIPLTNSSSQTIRTCTAEPEILKIETWISIAIFVIENLIINNWLNIKTIRFIMASRRRVNNRNVNSRNSSLSNRDRKFAFCSISLNLACIIFKLPFLLSFLITSYSNVSFEVISLVVQIVGTFTYTDNGFSFFVNTFVNSMFYEEFLRFFGLRKSPSNSIHNSNNNSVTKT